MFKLLINNISNYILCYELQIKFLYINNIFYLINLLFLDCIIPCESAAGVSNFCKLTGALSLLSFKIKIGN